MNHNFQNDMVSLVVKITCPECKVTSYVGSDFTAEAMQDNMFGLLGYFNDSKHREWIHCPMCDVAFNEIVKEKKAEWTDILQDVTPTDQVAETPPYPATIITAGVGDEIPGKQFIIDDMPRHAMVRVTVVNMDSQQCSESCYNV